MSAGPLRITDLRVATLTGVPFRSTIVRIDTNRDLSGYGEVRDQASATYALMLKSRLVGEDPRNVERLFRAVRQFGHHGRQGGGVSGVEMALMDLAGKAYGVPAYALAGGKYRDTVPCYADTETSPDPDVLAARLVDRRDRGFGFLKMDVGIDLLWDVPDALVVPPGVDTSAGPASAPRAYPRAGIQVTATGVDYLVDYVGRVRSKVGYDVPLAVDHLGPVPLESAIRVGRALEPFTLAWLEDLIPWQHTDHWRRLTTAITTPTCTGEDIYLAENFRPLLEAGAVSIVHPDPATAGGILETKRIGDLAERHGVGMALHLASSPIAMLAGVHVAAATRNCLALEYHALDVEGWAGLVTGLPEPLVEDGRIAVPETPGLGFEGIDEDVFRRFLDPADPVLFGATERWDHERSNDALWG